MSPGVVPPTSRVTTPRDVLCTCAFAWMPVMTARPPPSSTRATVLRVHASPAPVRALTPRTLLSVAPIATTPGTLSDAVELDLTSPFVPWQGSTRRADGPVVTPPARACTWEPKARPDITPTATPLRITVEV